MDFQIILNTADPAHSEIEAELRRNLSELETVKFTLQSQAAPLERSGSLVWNKLRLLFFSIRTKLFPYLSQW